jgi:predicted nucleic acid-binding protein
VILLDTSVLSRAFRRSRPGPREDALRHSLERLASGKTPLGIPALVLQEILSGIRSEKQFAELERKLVSSFHIVHPDTSQYREAARLRNRCLRAGLSVSGVDCLIAATAIAGGHQLFSMDEDFDNIARHAPLKLYRGKRSS